MIKKSLLFSALALLTGLANAESETVVLTITTGNETASVTTLMGHPTPIQWGHQKKSSTCSFAQDVVGTPIETTFSVDSITGTATTFLPLEQNAKGLKAYVTISRESAQNQEWAVINKDCKLPVGTTNSTGISVIDTFSWGVPTILKLSDGSEVIVTANQTARVNDGTKSSKQDALKGL